MNQTNTDYLFQTVPPGSNRASGTTGAGDRATGFGHHLNHASTSVFDVVRPGNRPDTPTDTRSSGRDTETTANPQPTRIASNPAGECEPSCERAKTADRDGDERKHADETDNNAAGDAAPAHAASADSKNDQTTNAQNPDAHGTTAATEGANPEVAGDNATNINMKIDRDSATDNPSSSYDQSDLASATTPSTTDDLTITDAAGIDADVAAAQRNDELAAESKPGVSSNTKDVAPSKQPATGNRDAPKDQQTSPNQASSDSVATANSLEHALPATNSATSTEGAAANDTTKPSDRDSRRGGSAASQETSSRGDTDTPAGKPDVKSIVGVLPNIRAPSENLAGANGSTNRPEKPAAAKLETPIGSLTGAIRSATDLAQGGRSAEAIETPQVDPARFVGRVAKAFHTAQERGGTLQLRLSPPELGSLKLQLTVKDGVLSAALETDNADARRVLLDHLPALRDRLAEQNIRVERFDVDVQQDSNRGQANPRNSHQNAHQHQPEQSEPRRTAATRPNANAPPPEPSGLASRIGNSRINLVV